MSATRTALLVLALLATLPGCGSSGGSGAVDLSADDGDGTNPRGTFTVSKETTRVTGPIDRDGYVDFAAAINKRMREGVTPDTNAVVLLWKAHGPRPEGGKGMPPEFFEELGIPAPPEDGDYFVDVNKYMRANPKLVPGREDEDFGELESRLTQRPWTAKEHPEMATWLKANEKPLALVVEATGRPQYYSPLIPSRTEKGPSGLFSTLMPGVQRCRAFASALAARAMLRVGEGAHDDAWRDLIACHRLGRLVGRGGTLIDALVGIAIDLVAGQSDLAFLDRAKLDAKQLERCLRDLRQLPPLPNVADKADFVERFMLLDTILMIDRHGVDYLDDLGGGGKANWRDPLAALFVGGTDWDPALQNANRWYDRLVAALRLKDRAARVMELQQIQDELVRLRVEAIDGAKKASPLVLVSSRARGEAIGNVLITLLLPAVSKVQDSADRATQTHGNLTVAFALAWYHCEHGRYPKSLDALAPKYLPRVPLDLFSGKALVYRPSENGYLLYSVGINGIDEGGRTSEDNPPGDDLSVRMPLPELRRQ